jgi:penicillin-binding protein 1A
MYFLISLLALFILLILYLYYRASITDVTILKNLYHYRSIRGVANCLAGLESETYIDPNKIPSFISLCFLLHEDDLFFEHKGANWAEIYQRIKAYFFNRKNLAGGSSITQQLAKLVFTGSKRTLYRKFKQFIIANKIEKHFSKDEILGLYYSAILFGATPHGVKAGCKHIFQKTPEELNLEEAFILVAFTPCPCLMEEYLLKNHDDSVFNYMTTFERIREALRICQVSLGNAELKDLKEISYIQVKKVMSTYSSLNTHSLNISQEQKIALTSAEFVYSLKDRIANL